LIFYLIVKITFSLFNLVDRIIKVFVLCQYTLQLHHKGIVCIHHRFSKTNNLFSPVINAISKLFLFLYKFGHLNKGILLQLLSISTFAINFWYFLDSFNDFFLIIFKNWKLRQHFLLCLISDSPIGLKDFVYFSQNVIFHKLL
jgi:hypothetical protein